MDLKEYCVTTWGRPLTPVEEEIIEIWQTLSGEKLEQAKAILKDIAAKAEKQRRAA